MVLSGGRHLLSLINDLLDLAKVEAGKIELQLEPTSCQEVLEEVEDALRPQAEAKGLVFTVEVPPQTVTIRTDRRALSQILINLANNAIKFTPVGKVNVRLERVESGVRFVVEDTGVGIAAADQQKLFEAFRRVGHAHSHEGTGLGLHLSRKLAELLGGRLTFTSTPGKGSTFLLELADA
jgi:protein-histidine pros-kinase